MAINKIPKNYYSDTNIRRDKINEIIDEVNDIASIPSPSAADAGKVVKVNSEGSYELGADASLPDVTESDNGKIVQVVSGSWGLRALSGLGIVYADSGALIGTTYNTGIRVISSATTPSFYMFGTSVGFSSIIARIQNNGMVISIDDNGTLYKGIITKTDSSTIYALVSSDGITLNEAIITSSRITYTPIGLTQSFVVAIAGTTVMLPQGCDYALLSSLISNGVEVILTDDISLYKVSKIDSTAETLIFTNMTISSGAVEVKQITVRADGTNTHETVTLS